MRGFIPGLLCLLPFLTSNVSARSFRAPVPKEYPSPHYPYEMEGSGIDGRAEIIFTVREDGSVENPSVKDATHPAFADAVLEVIEQWRFKPGLRDGQTASVRVMIPFVFSAGPVRKANAALGRVVYRTIDEIIYSPVEVGGLPEITHEPIAPYPRALLGSGRTEVVAITMVVGPEGKGYNMEVEGYPPREFIFSAIIAASQYRFKPVLYRGRPVHVYTRVTIVVTEDFKMVLKARAEGRVVGEEEDPLADYPDF